MFSRKSMFFLIKHTSSLENTLVLGKKYLNPILSFSRSCIVLHTFFMKKVYFYVVWIFEYFNWKTFRSGHIVLFRLFPKALYLKFWSQIWYVWAMVFITRMQSVFVIKEIYFSKKWYFETYAFPFCLACENKVFSLCVCYKVTFLPIFLDRVLWTFN